MYITFIAILTSVFYYLQEDGILVQLYYVSADPYLRGTIKTTGIIKAGSTLQGFVSGKVLHSKNPKWEVNDLFGANLLFSTYQIVPSVYLNATVIWKLTGLIDVDQLSLGMCFMHI